MIVPTAPQELATRMVGFGLSTYTLAERLGIDVVAVRSALGGNWHLIDRADSARIRGWIHHLATRN